MTQGNAAVDYSRLVRNQVVNQIHEPESEYILDSVPEDLSFDDFTSYIKNALQKDFPEANIEITDGNIKSFERVANKYNIDFALKKDKAASPPRYLVFFKARDVDVMNAAFKEYSAKSLTKSKKPSIRKMLAKSQEQARKQQRERVKEKQKDRGQEL